MKRLPLYVQDCGLVTPIGCGKKEIAAKLFAGSREALRRTAGFVPGREVYVGAVRCELSTPPEALRRLDCRNNRLMQVVLEQIMPAIARALSKYGPDRVAVILGTSTSGIAEGENALAQRLSTGEWPQGFDYRQQEISSLSRYAADYLGVTGPAYTIATACSSSAKVFASARRLIEAGIVDAAVVGGADSLCRTTLNGFGSLELLSSDPCNPFSRNRNGITIGEGASAFLLTREEGAVSLSGIGETSDAYHMTAPDPQGSGTRASMEMALADAGLKPQDIAYINLHGTATPLNDAMEAQAVAGVFGTGTPCGSTKGMTGHMLGATGGCEAGFLFLCLHPDFNPGLLPPHVWDGERDAALPPLNFVTSGTSLPGGTPLAMLSNSFGFGGSNASLIFSRV